MEQVRIISENARNKTVQVAYSPKVAKQYRTSYTRHLKKHGDNYMGMPMVNYSSISASVKAELRPIMYEVKEGKIHVSIVASVEEVNRAKAVIRKRIEAQMSVTKAPSLLSLLRSELARLLGAA